MSEVGATALALCLCYSGVKLASKTGATILGITVAVWGTIRAILIVTWGLSTLNNTEIPSYIMISKIYLELDRK